MFDGNLKLLIADDEAPARARLREMVDSIGGWNVVGEAANGEAVLQLCHELKPDVVLLDIRMPGMDGMEAATHLCTLEAPPGVVFTTAYNEYAVNAFETHAMGYLLKPVRRERLLRALERAARLTRLQMRELLRNNPELGGRNKIPVVSQSGVRLVPLDEVISFHADQKYVRMVHRNGEDLIDDSLKNLEEEFAHAFVRVHRNSLVRTECIEALEKDAGGQFILRLRSVREPVPVSRRLAGMVRERIT